MLSNEAVATIEHMKEMKKLRGILTLEEMRKIQKNNPKKLPDDAEKRVLTIKGVEVEKITLPTSKEESALIYIHGGGFKNGFASNGYWLTTALARLTCQTIYAINYRLSPEYKYPAAFMDCADVWKELLRSGIASNKSAMIGTSAGGSLVLSSSLYLRDHGYPLPSSLIVNSPFVGKNIIPTREEIEEDVILDYTGKESSYFDTADDDDPYAYPILGSYFLFPPLQIYVATKEILHSHSILLDKKLEEDRVEHELIIDDELWHAWLNSPVPENGKYIKHVALFIKRNMK